MKEYKFRAWDIDYKKMYYNIEHDCAPQGDTFNDWIEDKRFVIMQYIGLKDKNGKEIYEGDIVKIVSSSCSGYDEIDIVELRPPRFWLKNEEFGYEGEALIYPEETEIIGNICENPELLELNK